MKIREFFGRRHLDWIRGLGGCLLEMTSESAKTGFPRLKPAKEEQTYTQARLWGYPNPGETDFHPALYPQALEEWLAHKS